MTDPGWAAASPWPPELPDLFTTLHHLDANQPADLPEGLCFSSTSIEGMPGVHFRPALEARWPEPTQEAGAPPTPPAA